MAFVYSNDDGMQDLIWRMRYGGRSGARESKKVREFVAFHGKSSRRSVHASGKMQICSRLAAKMSTQENVILAYAAENNELMVIPSKHGNMKCARVVDGSQARYVMVLPFLLAVGFNRDNIPCGRYEANCDELGNIHVYLEKPLPDDEQSVKTIKYLNNSDIAALEEVKLSGKPTNIERR